ncbi:hypothetical protein D5086_016573 [Populus alba]|uniref:Uncharacterized protein n=2 Tax=Populus TaxID=3689 RepID=A0ACC4BVK9_POPAL|nr:hypothetical protein NC653_021200 [Populus alba x Populus x berolinensis]
MEVGNGMHWMTAFPWIPSLCTSIFSTGLCLWREHRVTLTLHDDLWDHDDPCLWNERSLMSLNKMASIGFRKCDHRLLLLTSQMAAMCDVLATETAIIYGLSQSGVLDLHGFFLVKGWGLLLCLVKCSAPGSYSLWKPKGAYIWIIFSVVSGKYEKRSEKGVHLLVSDE